MHKKEIREMEGLGLKVCEIVWGYCRIVKDKFVWCGSRVVEMGSLLVDLGSFVGYCGFRRLCRVLGNCLDVKSHSGFVWVSFVEFSVKLVV